MKLAAALFVAAVIPAVAWAQPAPADLRSSSLLVADGAHHESWTYRDPKADLSKYKAFIIEPTVVYADPAAHWGNTTPAQRAKFAETLTQDLRVEMGKRYTLATAPGPGVGVMRLTLLGVATTVPGVATVTRVTPIGLALNGVKSLAGKPGTFTGSAQIAFELSDSQSSELMLAAVRKRSPDALDIGASVSTENTVAAVSKDVAESIRKAVDKANGG